MFGLIPTYWIPADRQTAMSAVILKILRCMKLCADVELSRSTDLPRLCVPATRKALPQCCSSYLSKSSLRSSSSSTLYYANLPRCCKRLAPVVVAHSLLDIYLSSIKSAEAAALVGPECHSYPSTVAPFMHVRGESRLHQMK